MAKVMIEDILKIKDEGDTCGGIVEIIAHGVPSGLGEPVFDKLSADLAKAMINLLAPETGLDPDKFPIRYIGAKPGEKLYEELMSQEELSRTRELPSMFSILPALQAFYQIIDYRYPVELPGGENQNPYISSLQEPMTVAEIKAYLTRYGVLDDIITPKPYRLRSDRPTTKTISKSASPGG
jgi:hypothetical protein